MTIQNAEIDAAMTVDAIKSRVITAMLAADSGVRIRSTEYFNNTYAPDLILEWPNEKIARSVFLRTTANPAYLMEDLALLGEKSTILMPLGETRRNEATPVDLNAVSRQWNSLIATPESFDELATQQAEEPVVGFASRALLQGGSGSVGATQAATYGQSISDGFRGAKEGDTSPTAHALHEAVALLDAPRAGQIGDFLHAVWVGSGSDGLSFPGEAGLAPTLNASALMLLLDTVDIEDDQFWMRVGKNLTLDTLRDLEIGPDHDNFQKLVRAGGERMKVRSSRIVEADSLHYPSARWFAAKGELGLRLNRLTVLFGGGKVSDLSRPGIQQEISVSTLAARAEAAHVDVAEVTIASDKRRLGYAAADGTSVTADASLRALDTTMGANSAVSKATVSTSGLDLLLDFNSSTAHGRTGSSFYLSTMILSSLPLFEELDVLSAAELAAAVATEPTGVDNELTE